MNWNGQYNIEGDEQSQRTDATQLQDILKSYSNQDSVVWVKEETNKFMVQNREPRNKYNQLIFDKEVKAIQYIKVCSTNGSGTIGHPHAKRNLDTDLILFMKISSKQIIRLKVKCKSIKLLVDNTGKKPR